MKGDIQVGCAGIVGRLLEGHLQVRHCVEARLEHPGEVNADIGRQVIVSVATGFTALLLLVAATQPLRGQSRGELQVTARVIPAEQGWVARRAAIRPDLPQTSQLFRVTRMRRPGSPTTPDARREEQVVVVEFLAN